jgi:hypothetical protein
MKLLNKLSSILSKEKIGSIYAFKKGIYGAKMFVIIDKDKDNLNFLVLPDNLPLPISHTEFNYYKNTKTCEFIEVLPNFVLEVCKAQYVKSLSYNK